MMFAGDRLRAAIESVIRAMMPDPVYSGAWPATITAWDGVRQRAELATPQGSPLPRVLRGVPALVDPPGTKVTIPNGTPVLVAFRGSNPAAPFFRPAATWGDASVPLPLVELAGGGDAVAREGDSVSAGTLAFVPVVPPTVPPTLTVTWTPAIGAPVVLAVVAGAPGAQPSAELEGSITSGSARVTCG